MTIKHQGQNISAEIDTTELYDISITPSDWVQLEDIEAITLSRRIFHEEDENDEFAFKEPVIESYNLLDFFYTEDEVDKKIKIHLEIYDTYDELINDPNAHEENYLYLVPFTPEETGYKEGVYKEYVWIENKNAHEMIGSTNIDLQPILNRLSALEIGKENIANKKSVWSNPVTDTAYPSEALVKNTILESIDEAIDLLEEEEGDTETVLQQLVVAINNRLAAISGEIENSIDLTDYVTTDTFGEVVGELENTKVDKVTGKGLSTNDYTTEEKNKLSGIESSANNYSHPAAKQCNAVIPDISGKEDSSNKVTILDTNSDHYPNCPAVNTGLASKENKSNKVSTLNNSAINYPSTSAVTQALSLKADKAWTKITTTVGDLYVNESLGLAEFSFNSIVLLSSANEWVIYQSGVIPSGYRPKQDLLHIDFDGVEFTDKVIGFKIETNGDIAVYCTDYDFNKPIYFIWRY